MNSSGHLRAITIIGGGLAGLTLGIALRRNGVPVTLWEAGQYPRHRVCGEFISGRGLRSIERLGLLDIIAGAGARPATTAAFFHHDQASPPRRLPTPAWCISRFTLDALLANRFRSLGGELRENDRWRETTCHEGFVRASGRRLDPDGNIQRWYGLKVHAQNVALDADLEMHLASDSYVGICRLSNDQVNICGLFKTGSEARTPDNGLQKLRGQPGSILRQRLDQAKLEAPSACAIAGLSLEPRTAANQRECCIGDALTMVPPVTGNGMSVAFETAELAAEPLAAYSRGEWDWAGATKHIARTCDAALARRLRWGHKLQRALFRPAERALLFWTLKLRLPILPILFSSTR